MAPLGPIPNPEVKHRRVDGSRTIGPARVDRCQDSTTPVGESQQGLTAFGAGPFFLLVHVAARCVLLAHVAAGLCARWWRAPAAAARCAHGPRGKGLRAPPSDSYPRQAELAGCLLCAHAHVCASRSFFVLAHGATRPCARLLRASAAAVRFAHGPRGKGLRAPPSDSLPRQAELAGFLLRAARACALRAGVFLCWRMQPPARLCFTPLVRTTLVCFSAAVCLAPRIAARLLH